MGKGEWGWFDLVALYTRLSKETASIFLGLPSSGAVSMFGKNILILVPHPDDEVVMCGAAIGRAKAQGARVSALYLTNGCLDRPVLWPWQRKHHEERVQKRRAEAESAALFLGLTPVGWSDRPARHLWRNVSDVYAEVQKMMAVHRPDQVWVPAYEGGNPDHDALNALGAQLKKGRSVLEFAVYTYFAARVQSQTFISWDETARLFTLSPEERRAKQKALDIYASERRNLSSLRVDQESYRPLAAYDYAQPPHQGTLWYNRFQWVPFRHPFIDRTSPADVSEEITAFLYRTTS